MTRRRTALIISGTAVLAVAVATALVGNPLTGGLSSLAAGLNPSAMPVAQVSADAKSSLVAATPTVTASIEKSVLKPEVGAKRKASRHTRRYARVRRPIAVAPTAKT